jgi:hypothetical protein
LGRIFEVNGLDKSVKKGRPILVAFFLPSEAGKSGGLKETSINQIKRKIICMARVLLANGGV